MSNALKNMAFRIPKFNMLNEYNTLEGVSSQQARMIMDKRKSFSRALLYSYQAAWVKKESDENWSRALINPDKIKQDYDEKIISIGFEYNYTTGDVFEWKGTNSYWLIYLRDMTELAYFRGQIRRCCYEIWWEDNNKINKTHAALRGPVETKIDYIQKHGISVDNPNYSLNLLIPKNEETLKLAKRYTKFYLQGDDVCWRIEAVDRYSMENIIEINAVEYYANETEDDIPGGLVGTLVEKKINVSDPSEIIVGDEFIKPKFSYTYSYVGVEPGEWKINSKMPLNKTITENNELIISTQQSYSGQFEIEYGPHKKTVVVQSLF